LLECCNKAGHSFVIGLFEVGEGEGDAAWRGAIILR